ncbi:MAG: hypothetical protein ACE5KF_12165 [Kiloniellaceae bacterium]
MILAPPRDARALPELRLDLPPTAVGKDDPDKTGFAAPGPRGTGYRVPRFGPRGRQRPRACRMSPDVK